MSEVCRVGCVLPATHPGMLGAPLACRGYESSAQPWGTGHSPVVLFTSLGTQNLGDSTPAGWRSMGGGWRAWQWRAGGGVVGWRRRWQHLSVHNLQPLSGGAQDVLGVIVGYMKQPRN